MKYGVNLEPTFSGVILDAHANSTDSTGMSNIYDTSAPKKATNLTVNSDLLSQAKALGINISAVLEQSLAERVKRLKMEAWVRENQSAIHAYNRDVQTHGTFSEDLRSF